MKNALAKFPEIFGLLLGLLDAVPRLLASMAYAPSKASLHGWLLLGNVHHVNGPKGLGLNTMQWFGISAIVLALLYAGVQVTAHLLRPTGAWFAVARGALGVVAGVLALNVAESLVTGKVTDYIGWVVGTRFTAVNFGDVLVWLALLVFAAAFSGGLAVRALQAPGRA